MRLRWSAFGILAVIALGTSSCGSGGSTTQPNPTPIVTALFPASITAGSQSFTLFIAGQGFISGPSGTSTAYWNGSPRTTTVNLQTAQIELTVLASDVAAAGTASITVSNPSPGGGISQSAGTFQIFSVQTGTPLILSLSPTTAAPRGADFMITVNGSNFSTGSTVAWNSGPRSTSFVNSGQLTAQIPATDIATAGCNSISVFSPTGGGNFIFSPSISFTVASTGAPVICSISPASAPAGAAAFNLSVNGAGYGSGSTVQWNGSPRTTMVIGPGSLQAQITATDLAKAGTASITVANSGSGGKSAPVNFVITPPPPATPTITSVMPATATAGGQAFTLSLTGTNFVPDSVVNWNGGPRTTSFKNITTLQAQIQVTDIATAGTAQVTVSTTGENGAVAVSAPFPFSITAAGASAKFPQVISVSAAGGPANGPSEAPSISSSGRYVAFYSLARNLIAQPNAGNIFVRDTCVGVANCTPKTIPVDLAVDGSAPNGKTGRQVSISGDGRFVAFVSRATNLTTGNGIVSPGYWEVYIRDLCNGANAPSGCVPRTEMISLGAEGDAANGPSSSPSLSGDGRFVAFVSAATNLVAETPSLRPQAYVRDTCAGPTGTKACISRTVAVIPDNEDRIAGAQAGRPAISADGRYVAFEMWAANSGTQTAISTSQVILADTCLGIDAPVSCTSSAQKVSYAPDGSALSGANISPSISGDARFVAFEAQPSESAAGNTAGASKVLLRDTCLGGTAPDGCQPSTTLILNDMSGAAGKLQSFSPTISTSGRYISFVSGSSANASTAEVIAEGSLVVRDTCFGANTKCAPHTYAIVGAPSSPASITAALANFGGSPNGAKSVPTMADRYSQAPVSADGRFAAFYAPNTVAAEPASGTGDVFLTVTPF
jgi:hypothetical protein